VLKHFLFRVFFALALVSAASSQSLRQEAESAGVLIGTAIRPAQLGEAEYSATVAREFNMAEAEDAMKWRALRPDEGSFDFRSGDEMVRFALAHQMKVRGHCLVWGRDNPDWLTGGQFTEQQLRSLLHRHIERVMKHYAGEVFAWDVVNEALDEQGEVRDSIWYNQPGIGFAGQGTAYLEQVFRWAHKANPGALLFYNDAEGEGLNRKSDAIYAMAKDFKRRRVPLDGIGLQMHVSTLDGNISLIASSISANIARIAALGLQVHITELDISLPIDSSGRARSEDLLRQAELYRGIVRACLDNRGCTAIQTWGFTDKYSWIGSHSRGTRGQALLFDREYTPKPAYRAVLEELSAGRALPH
jgi:endo-1,4-beta-xylanase